MFMGNWKAAPLTWVLLVLCTCQAIQGQIIGLTRRLAKAVSSPQLLDRTFAIILTTLSS